MRACLLLIALSIASCTSTTRIDVLRPAQIDFPNNIEKIATINRSLPKSGIADMVEAGFSGEIMMLDFDAAEVAIGGLTAGLDLSPRFKVKPTGISMKSGQPGRFTTPLNWREVRRLCATYDVDALAVLEYFDSNLFRDVHKLKPGKKDKGPRFEAAITAEVNMGWRIYDPENRTIIDEFKIVEGGTFEADGKSKKEAIHNLPTTESIVFNISEKIGRKYSNRIAPNWKGIKRQWYPKAGRSKEFKRAAKLAKRDNWQRAMEIWKPLTYSSSEKIAGRASYNMAVGAEALGELQVAHSWALKAWKDFGNKRARTYIVDLQMRLQHQNILRKQMAAVEGP